MCWKRALWAATLVIAALGLAGCPPNAIHSLTLVASPAGAGQITAMPTSAGYLAGTVITLEAVPAPGWTFRNWVGVGINNSVNPAYLRIYADTSITAVFVPEGGGEGEGEGEAPAEVVRDGGFEEGSGAWTQLSLAYADLLICDAPHCGQLGGIGAYAGQHWAYFGSAPDGAEEAASLSQDIVMPRTGQATLQFQLAAPRAEAPFDFRVFFGRNMLFEISEADAAEYATYQPVSIDVSALADGSAGTLVFTYINGATAGAVIGVFVDDVSIAVPGGEGEGE